MASATSGHGESARTIPLSVLRNPKPRSRMGWPRALVLIAVHVLVAIHVAQWLITGSTLSPVEPSESMYTLERGWVNAGFIMFALAIVSTLLLGRWFCGWVCHVVALQDLCAALMRRIGVRPRPLRVRLLRWAPLMLGLYMFVWPTAKREVVRPIATSLGMWDSVRAWIGETPPRVFSDWNTASTFFRSHLIVRDFWATFPPWYVAIPFLFVCGFACVCFLGSKGFCTYACPYGAFFGIADRIAPARIRVTDACKHCGHCTSVCTSNVRVHEEVRDYGMVIDPGCMKCLDCVSACPSDALYFGIGTPAAFARPKKQDSPQFADRVHDWSWRQELAYAILFLLFFMGFRGLLGLVPILMAMGLAACATFLCWKCEQLVREPNVRLQSLQLRLKGRLKLAGLGTIALTIIVAGIGFWGTMGHSLAFASAIFAGKINATPDQVFMPNYTPNAKIESRARMALKLGSLSSVPAYGGIGDRSGEDHLAQLAWLAAVSGDATASNAWFERAVIAGARAEGDVSQSTLNGFATSRLAQGTSVTSIVQTLEQIAAQCPKSARVRLMLAQALSNQGKSDRAVSLSQEAVDRRPQDPDIVSEAAGVMLNLGQVDRAQTLIRHLINEHPTLASAHRAMAAILAHQNRLDEALKEAERAIELDPNDPENRRFAAELLRAMGRDEDAAGRDPTQDHSRR